MQLEFSLAAVWAGHEAVQHIPRVADQIVCLLRPGHAAHEHVAVDDVGLDGLMRGDPSDRSVPSIATRLAASRAMPSRTISGAPRCRSRQPAMLADEVTSVTVQPARMRVPAACPARRRREGWAQSRHGRRCHQAAAGPPSSGQLALAGR